MANIKNNVFYNSNSITVFPSSSAPTGTNGRVLSENMLSSITTSIVDKNFILEGFDATHSSRNITFSSGHACIDGKQIVTKSSITITIPSASSGTLNGAVVLALSKTALQNIKGVSGTTHSGVLLGFVETTDFEQLENEKDILILGYIYKLNNGSSVNGNTWFVNRERFFKINAKSINVDMSYAIPEIANDIKNLANENLVDDSLYINVNDDSYNRNLSLQDFIKLSSNKWFMSKYGDQYNGNIDIVCNSSQSDADDLLGSRYITFWGSNSAKNNRTQDRVKIYYTSSSSGVLGINGAINITNGIASNGTVTTNTSLVAKYVVGVSEISNVSILANANGRYMKMKNTTLQETDSSVYVNTSLPIQITANSNVTKTVKGNIAVNVAGNTTYTTHSKVVYNLGTNTAYGNNSYFSAVNNTKYYLGNNVVTNLGINANISIGNNAKVTMGNNSILQVNNTKLYSNGRIEANTISLMGSSTYIFFNNTSSPYFYYTSSSVSNVHLRSANLYIDNGILSASKVYNAVYNDYAELYEKDDITECFCEGDVIEINPSTGKYRKTVEYCSQYVVGVYSNTYGHLLGGCADKSMEDNLKTHIPIGLCGRVYVNVDTDCIVCVGDRLVSAPNGKAKVLECGEKYLGCVIGKALSKNTNGKVLMQIMLQ